MDQQTTVINNPEIKLTDAEQAEVVNYIKTCWTKGVDAREKYEEDADQCLKAYHCEVEEVDSPELEWQENLCLPWAFDAVESWRAYMHQTMMPKQDDIFTIKGKTKEDHAGAEVMQEFMDHQLNNEIQFPSIFDRILYRIGTQNHVCAKVYWKKDKTVSHDPIDEYDQENGGKKKGRKENEHIEYNNVWVDLIDLKNFVVWPIHGDINKTTRIHETYRFYEDVMADAKEGRSRYFNLNQLSLDDEKTVEQENTQPYWQSTSEYNQKRVYQGLNIKEAWVFRCKINDKVYRNYIATIVNDKTLIRFEPNPYPMGKSPFIFSSLRPDGDCLYGYGLLSKALPILRAANLLFNQRLNEEKIKMNVPNVYWDDNVFNPYNVIMQPGGMIEMSQESVIAGNLRPLVSDFAHLQLAFSEVAELKGEFESITVPKVVKGLLEAGDRTATEIAGVQNNSSSKMHMDAFQINQNVLKLALELFYLLIFTKAQEDPEVLAQIARVTQPSTETINTDEQGQPLPEPVTVQIPIETMIEKIPNPLPLPEVDIKVVGYQNVIRKQETLAAMSQTLPGLAQSPAGKYLKWYNIAETTFVMSELDKDILLVTADERDQIDEQDQQEQEKQQELLIAQQAMQMQLEQVKEEHNYELDQMKLQLQAETDAEKLKLQELEMMLKYMQTSQQINMDLEAMNAGLDRESDTPGDGSSQSDMAA